MYEVSFEDDAGGHENCDDENTDDNNDNEKLDIITTIHVTLAIFVKDDIHADDSLMIQK